MSSADFRDIDPREAERLVAEGAVRILDVRTPEEYREIGHIPGAVLLPVDLIAAGAATLVDGGKPLLVTCEHGVRSAHAAGLLAKSGMPGVLNLSGGMSAWSGPREFSAGDPFGPAGPSSWLVENADLLRRGGSILDVACGSGRHALLLAAAGFRVHAVDRDAGKTDRLREVAGRLGLAVHVDVMDLEGADLALPGARYDAVVCFRYLHRPLFPTLIEALRPGGVLLYETFTTYQAERGHPANPAYLLEPGELARLAGPLHMLRRREGEFHGQMISSLAARKKLVGAAP